MRRELLLAAGLVGLLGCDHARLHGRITRLTHTDRTYTIAFSAGDCAIREFDGVPLDQEYAQLAYLQEAQQAVWVPETAIGEKQGECYLITAAPR